MWPARAANHIRKPLCIAIIAFFTLCRSWRAGRRHRNKPRQTKAKTTIPVVDYQACSRNQILHLKDLNQPLGKQEHLITLDMQNKIDFRIGLVLSPCSFCGDEHSRCGDNCGDDLKAFENMITDTAIQCYNLASEQDACFQVLQRLL